MKLRSRWLQIKVGLKFVFGKLELTHQKDVMKDYVLTLKRLSKNGAYDSVDQVHRQIDPGYTINMTKLEQSQTELIRLRKVEKEFEEYKARVEDKSDDHDIDSEGSHQG